MAIDKKRKKLKKKDKVDPIGVAHIKATFNNTLLCLSDSYGNIINWSSGGKVGYKGSKKNTSFAAQMASEQIAKEAMGLGLRKVNVIVKGPGAGRESSIRALNAAGLEILSIKDITPVPHNGCRPKKKRRI
ncbi:MAG: 30S ribosomal protein S11 [Candidatus Delongbacteria bacterium]|nr:30S ribosomal protein S11 [Candidatus Delongbacteria bacterium]MDD4204528.1 30S ribosomal protein S11 [Candidatus Delongbacteria bacterium]MDY0017466.1 30S ribosomal protein S11 [Candidatus Delongbacteria bacterium]